MGSNQDFGSRPEDCPGISTAIGMYEPEPCFLGFADELSLFNAKTFAENIINWYRRHDIKLKDTIWYFDGGSEYTGNIKAREFSIYRKVLAKADIIGIQIPKTTYNAEVETIHHTIEFQFFEVESFENRTGFIRKATTYQLWYNLYRKTLTAIISAQMTSLKP